MEAWTATNCWSQIRRMTQEVQKQNTATVNHLDAICEAKSQALPLCDIDLTSALYRKTPRSE